MPEPDQTNTPPAPRRVGVREFRGDLTGFLRQVRQGTSFLITSHDQVVAELHPPSSMQRTPRRPGGMRGKIKMAQDFDTLPADVQSAMENDDN